MEQVVSLWSGGIDSTVMTYYLSQFYTVQPLHVLIRHGSGKDIREREATDAIFKMIQAKHPDVLPIVRVKQRIPASDERNVALIKLAKTLFPNATKIAIGG